VAISRDHGNDPLCSTKGAEILDQMSEYKLKKKDVLSLFNQTLYQTVCYYGQLFMFNTL
jgi:hypothetical protein